jgi:pimeloyl-ACP methyl ester carboxylesterase
VWLAQPDYSTEARDDHVPTLVIAGGQDVITPEHTMALFRAVPNAQLCIVPNEGHGVLPEETVLTFFSASDSLSK